MILLLRDLWEWLGTFSWLSQLGEGEDSIGNYWVKAKGVAQCPIMHKTVFITKNDQVQDISSVAIDKLWA